MTSHTINVIGTIVLVVLMIAIVVFLTGGAGGDTTAPADWNPNPACRQHGGIAQTQGSGYTVAVVCRDGLYVSNPHD